MPTTHKPLPGSTPKLQHGVHAWAARTDASERIAVTIHLHRREALPADFHEHHMGRAEFGHKHGAHPDAVKDVVGWAEDAGLTVVETNRHRRRVVVEGKRDAIEAAFKVELHEFEVETPGNRCYSLRSYYSPISLPDHLHPHVLAVLGFDTRPIAKPHFRLGYFRGKKDAIQTMSPGSFTPPQVAALYDFPAPENPGQGQTIALIELGGGSRQRDINAYFASLGLPAPSIASVPVDGGRNSPGSADGPDGEVMLDIEVAGSIAPHANLAVYYAANTDQGFCDAISQAAHDATRDPSVISISWGGPESNWSGQAVAAMNAALEDCAALGITVTVAAGDNGSDDGVGDGENHVDFPGSSPYVLCCGGTKLVASGGAITSETVWGGTPDDGATGGGYSDLFQTPDWQQQTRGQPAAPGRGVPDVAGNADPASGYEVLVDGEWTVVGGTSAVAPEWAALIVLRNQIKGQRSGFINPLLYANPHAFRDITEGSNGAFSAGPGWDACTGLGLPIGSKVAAL
jgi:kumamolisin